MLKFFLFSFLLLPAILAQPRCAPDSNCICDPQDIEFLRANNWYVVPWDTGQCYFHNFVTRENVNNLPTDVLEALKRSSFL